MKNKFLIVTKRKKRGKFTNYVRELSKYDKLLRLQNILQFFFKYWMKKTNKIWKIVLTMVLTKYFPWESLSVILKIFIYRIVDKFHGIELKGKFYDVLFLKITEKNFKKRID